MRIAMTGATSFVGAAAATKLLAEGHQVIAVVRPHSDHMHVLTENQEQALLKKRLLIVENDLSEPELLPEKISGALREAGLASWEKKSSGQAAEEKPAVCDVFCHFGWGGSGSASREDETLQRQNKENALLTIRQAKRLGCKKFLFSGSQAEYGRYEGMIGEEAECRPRSAYGEAKLAVRTEGEALCRSLGIQYIHVRIFSAYGPGDHPWTLVESCLEAFLAGKEISLGACSQSWNFLHIGDLSRGICSLIEKPAEEYGKLANPVFNLAGAETKPLREFVEDMRRLCGGKGEALYGTRGENAEGLVNLDPDIRKLCAFAGWRPEISFEEGIRGLIKEKQGGK